MLDFRSCAFLYGLYYEPGWGQCRDHRQSLEKVNPVSPLAALSFAHPASRDFPWVRLNMPASADPAELASEIQDLHDKHIGGIEVGQGAFPSNVQLIAIYQSANRFGIKVSLSHGPTQYPAGYSINDDNARKTLAYGNAIVESGRSYDGPVPAALPPALPHFPMPPGRARREGPPGPPPASPRTQEPQPRTTLVAVLAFRCTANPCPKNGAAELDRASVIDLTSSVTDKNTLGVLTGTTAGNLHWTAPDSAAGAQWQVIAFWTRGVFAQPDPFSTEGFDQLVQSLETGLSPEVKELMKVNRGDIFYDSHTGDRGSADELWTNELPEQFQNREHYDLIPNLPSLFPSAFVMSDGSSARVRTDLYRVRGDLWIETQIIPLKAWVRRYNNFLRVQPEGEMMPDIPITDEVLAASVLDRPEHESLFTNDEVDNYLPIASANHMTGNSWYSTECCAALNMNYAQTFQDITIRMHRSFAGGITQIVQMARASGRFAFPDSIFRRSDLIIPSSRRDHQGRAFQANRSRAAQVVSTPAFPISTHLGAATRNRGRRPRTGHCVPLQTAQKPAW